MSDFIPHPSLQTIDFTIDLIDKATNTILASFLPQDSDKAYAKAIELEEYGLDILIRSPGVCETLVSCLSDNPVDQEQYNCSVEQEWKDHD